MVLYIACTPAALQQHLQSQQDQEEDSQALSDMKEKFEKLMRNYAAAIQARSEGPSAGAAAVSVESNSISKPLLDAATKVGEYPHCPLPHRHNVDIFLIDLRGLPVLTRKCE